MTTARKLVAEAVAETEPPAGWLREEAEQRPS